MDLATLPPVVLAFASAAAALAGAGLARLYPDIRPLTSTVIISVAIAGVLPMLLLAGPVPAAAALWSVVLVVPLAAIALVDLGSRTIPDLFVLPLIVLGLAHAWLTGPHGTPFAIAALAIVGAGGLGALILRGRAGWIGAGDVLLAAAAVAWVGPGLLPDLMIAAALAMLAHAGLARLFRPPAGQLPLGPSLTFAIALLWFGGPIF